MTDKKGGEREREEEDEGKKVSDSQYLRPGRERDDYSGWAFRAFVWPRLPSLVSDAESAH